MIIDFDTTNADSYRQFLAVRNCPVYHFEGWRAVVPDEYATRLGVAVGRPQAAAYQPIPGLFDYQRDIARLAIQKQKFAVFADCGLGKTLILLEFARHAMQATGKRMLIVAPLMVVEQTVEEARRFCGSLPIEQVRAAALQEWMHAKGPAIGVTNYEAIREGLDASRLAGIVLDESSMLKNHYGEWGLRLI